MKVLTSSRNKLLRLAPCVYSFTYRFLRRSLILSIWGFVFIEMCSLRCIFIQDGQSGRRHARQLQKLVRNCSAWKAHLILGSYGPYSPSRPMTTLDLIQFTAVKSNNILFNNQYISLLFLHQGLAFSKAACAFTLTLLARVQRLWASTAFAATSRILLEKYSLLNSEMSVKRCFCR